MLAPPGIGRVPAKPSRALADFNRTDGPPLTTRELAELTAMSASFIRSEIRSGALRAAIIGRGRKRVFRITFQEARRYLEALGLM